MLSYVGPIRLFLPSSTPSLNIIFLAEVSNFVIVIYVGPLSLRQSRERERDGIVPSEAARPVNLFVCVRAPTHSEAKKERHPPRVKWGERPSDLSLLDVPLHVLVRYF